MGEVGGRYRLVERLGAGGMSVVWRGYDEVLGRQVAVKVLAPALAGDRAFRHRIRAEAQAAARLSHPHITNVYDYGEHDGVPYVVMELVDGVPLSAVATPMPWEDAVAICAEVGSALAAAHGRGVVHRDVAPGNVMLTAAGAKVVDFGISAVVGEQEVGPDGSVLGTPAYIAPERLAGGQVSASADVYGLGLLLYRCLAGRLPWPATSRVELLRAHLYEPPADLPAIDALPPEVAELCMRCLAKSPADRPTSAEVVEALLAAGAPVGRPVSPAPVTTATTGETTILPRTTDPDALPTAVGSPPVGSGGGGEPGGPGRPRGVAAAGAGKPAASGRRAWRRVVAVEPRRRLVVVAVAAVLALALAGTVLAGVRGGDGTDRTVAAAAGPPVSGPGGADADVVSCEVRYALRSDSGRRFDADLTVVNVGRAPVRDWSLAFTFPGDQRITRAAPATVEQEGSAVVLRPAGAGAAVPAGGSAAVRLSGSYTRSNAFPVEFRLDGAFCDPKLSTATPTTPPAPATKAPPPKKPPKAAKDGDSGKGSSGKGKGNKGKGGKGKSGDDEDEDD